MNHKLVHVLITLAWFASYSCARAQCVESQKIDSLTDVVSKSVTSANRRGDSLSFYRLPNGQVWANFSLSSNTSEVLSSRHPVYRIDKNESVDLDKKKLLNQYTKLVEGEPRWVNFVVFHGEGPVGKGLADFLEGKNVLFRYYLFTGGYKETVIPLEGCADMIIKALNLTWVRLKQ